MQTIHSKKSGVLITLKSLLAALWVSYNDFNVYIRHLYVYSDIVICTACVGVREWMPVVLLVLVTFEYF